MGSFEVGPCPGKTTPRLLQDILDYDPRRARKPGNNLLTDPPPQYKPPKLAPLRFLPEDCQHRLFRKDNQSRVPPFDEKPNGESYYVSASYCAICFYHFEVIADYCQRPDRKRPCDLNHEYPLHHLQHFQSRFRSEDDIQSASDNYDSWTEKHRWSCSAPDCPVLIEVRISAPRLSKRHLRLLSDSELVFSRGTRSIEADPVRYEGVAPLPPTEVLSILRQYLYDALKGGGKRVAVRNKKFLLAFSDDCDEIFRYLKFQLESEEQNGVVDKFWTLPVLAGPTTEPYPKTNRQLVEDVVIELNQRLHDLAQYSKIIYNPLPAMKDLEKTLGMTDYPRASRVINLEESTDESPYFAGLGAIGTFEDQLIAFAYRRQCACDPQNKPYYLECLEDIANGRGSADLQEELVMVMSLGGQTQKTIDDAYKFFGLNAQQPNDDQHIIGLFRSRIEAAPRQTEEARACLRTIASARDSVAILEEANNEAMTAEEAYRFLDVTTTTDSDSIQAAAIVARIDGDATKVARAVKAIAEQRNDIGLRFFANNSDPASLVPAIGVGEAYGRLQIPDQNVPDETVLTYFKSLSQSAPAGSKQSFLEALNVIAEVRASELLKAQVRDPDSDLAAPRGTVEHPIGLDNIGNTCYLNSLLQYYYTVKTVREVVMNFDDYRMPLNVDTLSAKRVGGRAVTRAEIRKAQKFVEELRDLFMNLKSASTRSVKPTQDLAELTLFSTATEANFRRASVSSPLGPGDDLTLGGTVYGADLPPPPVPTRPAPAIISGDDTDIEMIDRPQDDTDEDHASDSTSTLVDVDQSTQNGLNTQEVAIERTIVSPEPTIFSRGFKNSKISVTEVFHVEDTTEEDPESFNTKEDLNVDQPPPIPPRSIPAPINTSGETEDSIRAQRLNFGAQQDVTEVIGNVMFRLQCAIKATSIDPEFGEQIDQIRETFYGANAVSLKKAANYDVKFEAWANIIVFPSLDGSRDIYEALDVVFDEQTVEIDKTLTTQFASISKLPPILQIQIQRTAYNPVTQQASKNQNRIVFDETIYLDRYMSNEKVLERRKDAWRWKNRLRQLEARQRTLNTTAAKISVPDALDITTNLLKELQEEEIPDFEVDPGITDILEERRQEISRELEVIAEETTALKQKLQDQFTDLREHRYRLQAVFMHRGSSSYGHYWIYIYDFEREIWREYNDEYVSIVNDRKQIFEQTVNGATPYYLVYVRDDDKNDLVDAVCREITETPLNDRMDTDWIQPSDENMEASRLPIELAQENEKTPGSGFAVTGEGEWNFSRVDGEKKNKTMDPHGDDDELKW